MRVEDVERTSRARDAVFAEYSSRKDLQSLQDLLFRSAPNTLIFVELTTQKPVEIDPAFPPSYARARARYRDLMPLASEFIEVEKVDEGKHRAIFLKSFEHPLKVVEFSPEAYFNVYKYVWTGWHEISTKDCAQLLVRLGY